MTTEKEWSSVLGGRWKEKTRSERVAVEHSKPVQQPLGMTDHRESNNAGMIPVGLTSRLIRGVDVFHS